MINQAYKYLLEYEKEEHELENCDIIRYEVIVEKAQGIGLGLSVTEDKARGIVYVSGINEKTKIIGITEESEGEIKINDILIGIDNDHCSRWILSRIRARLDSFRVPVGKRVTFSFERRIPKEDYEDEESVSDVTSSRATSPMRTTRNENTTPSGTPIRAHFFPSDYSKEPASAAETEKEKTADPSVVVPVIPPAPEPTAVVPPPVIIPEKNKKEEDSQKQLLRRSLNTTSKEEEARKKEEFDDSEESYHYGHGRSKSRSSSNPSLLEGDEHKSNEELKREARLRKLRNQREEKEDEKNEEVDGSPSSPIIIISSLPPSFMGSSSSSTYSSHQNAQSGLFPELNKKKDNKEGDGEGAAKNASSNTIIVTLSDDDDEEEDNDQADKKKDSLKKQRILMKKELNYRNEFNNQQKNEKSEIEKKLEAFERYYPGEHSFLFFVDLLVILSCFLYLCIVVFREVSLLHIELEAKQKKEIRFISSLCYRDSSFFHLSFFSFLL
jgi:hypothetical protein